MFMKKLFTLSLFIYLTFSSSAQISKGSLLLGGDFSAFTQTQKQNLQKNNNNGVYFSPLIGKAVKNNLIKGVYLQLGYRTNENISNQLSNKTKNSDYGAGIFIRKYSGINNNFYGFLQGNLGFSYNKNKNESATTLNENKQRFVGVNLSPGLSYKVSGKLHLEAGLREIASLGYSVMKSRNVVSTTSSDSKTNSFSVSTSLNNFSSNLYFGFRLLLAGKS
jgi:hypothetical protein